MIELLLEAERALSVGMLDQAERLYWQTVEHDARNSIAVVGLARVALERRDDRTALEFGRRALAIDPLNAAAGRLVTRLEEVMRARGEPIPETATPPQEPAPPAPESTAPRPSEPAPESPTPTSTAPPPRPRAGLLRRLIRRG